MSGYVKIHRKITEWEWYSNPVTRAVFLHLLFKANWKDGRFMGVDIPRGSLATSLPSLSEETGYTIQQVRTALSHLKSTGEITDKAYSKFRVVEIKNYSMYQDDNSQDNSQSTGNQQAANRQSTAIEEKKESKKVRREEYNPPKSPLAERYFEDDEVNQRYLDYLKSRRENGHPLKSKESIKANAKKLHNMAKVSGVFDKRLALEILEQSIANGWQGLFEPKIDRRKGINLTVVDDWLESWEGQNEQSRVFDTG